MCLNPWQTFLRRPNDHPRQCFIRIAFGHADQVIEILILIIAVDQHRQRTAMQAAKISGVARIAAAIRFRCRLNYCAKGSVSTTNNNDINLFRHWAGVNKPMHSVINAAKPITFFSKWINR